MGWPKPCLRPFLIVAFILFVLFQCHYCASNGNNHANSNNMTKEERENLKEEARDMFYHAYRAYMENAYPADELMPLTCQGRYRGLFASRGDMDDILGNFSLTLIDTLDTLAILGDFEEFEHAVKLIIRDVTFDSNIVVSVFETNIRVLGGLLSGHIIAEYLQIHAGLLPWYRGELLAMAKDLGYRLIPAFNTTTGIPHGKVNLRHGLKTMRMGSIRETCTACAGTMILEMAALSRFTGEPIFEEKAHRAMDELWKLRHRNSDLMGTVLNVFSGEWVRRESGVGAGIDSYYEYCLKAYILLGDERYLERFNRHYSAVMKYVSQGPMLLDVHMHRPHTNSKNFMDALLAFWPGLQVLKGDIRPAVETHEMLYQIMQRHNFIPEAFTTDFQVHWGQHPLRPEFLESTYFLHRATNDPYYLQVGKTVLKSLQKYARVPCGYAAVGDVRTGAHEDRMDSFVLAETFKYLFLLFADESDLVLNLNDFLFTTEAHLLPLSLALPGNYSLQYSGLDEANSLDEDSRTCPTPSKILPENVRRPLQNMVDGVCPKKNNRRRLTAAQFQVSDPHHLNIAKDMGITIMSLTDGRIQLLHSYSSARSVSDAEEGLLFMQEMVELSKAQAGQPDAQPQGVLFHWENSPILLTAGPSHFGPELRGVTRLTGKLVIAFPFRACTDLENAKDIAGHIAVVERGDCMFVDKVRRIQEAGAVAGIVIDNTPGSSATSSPFFAMSGDGQKNVNIPAIFLFADGATSLISAFSKDSHIEVTLGEYSSLKSEISKNQATAGDDPKPITVSSDAEDNVVAVGDFICDFKTKLKIKYQKGASNEPLARKTSSDAKRWRSQVAKIISAPNTFVVLPELSEMFLLNKNIRSDLGQKLMVTWITWLLTEFQLCLNDLEYLPSATDSDVPDVPSNKFDDLAADQKTDKAVDNDEIVVQGVLERTESGEETPNINNLNTRDSNSDNTLNDDIISTRANDEL